MTLLQGVGDVVYLHCLGKVQVVLCYNINACWLPLFLDRISDSKPAGFYFGAENERCWKLAEKSISEAH